MNADKEKIIDKVAKLKAHAESAAAIGNEKEARAFAEMFQRLLIKHELDMTDIEYAERDKEEPVERFEINPRAHGIESEGRCEQWWAHLAGIIARGNFCRILTYAGSKHFALVGRKSHVAIAEYMIVTLTRAAEEIADKERTKYAWERYKETRDATGKGTANVKGFKASFLLAFTQRLYERYEEIKRGAATGNGMALVRFNDADAKVREFMDNIKGLRHKRNKMVRAVNAAGLRRGRAAADNIDLNGKAMNGGAARPVARLR